MFSWRKSTLVLLLVGGLIASVAPAYAQTTGVIQGTVTDAQDAVLPGVTVTLRNTETGVTRTEASDGRGVYRFPGLPPGTYDLAAELQGFSPVAVKQMTLSIGGELRQNLQMKLQQLQESVTVTASAPVIETTRTEVSQVITQEQIATLPMSDRTPNSLVLLLPGTNMDNTQTHRAQANIGAGGINNQMNAYFLDGASNWSTNSGQQHAEMPQLAVQEFRVNVAQASAEHGGNVAGLVSTVTKSGTNTFSGEALDYVRTKSLTAINRDQEAIGGPKPSYKRTQPGFGVGGPIVKDRIHYFGAIEYLNENKTFTVNSGQPQFYNALYGTYPTNYQRKKYFIRGDVQLTSQQSLFIRYAYDLEHIDCEACGGGIAAFSANFTDSPRDTNVIGYNWVMSPSNLNEFRVQGPARLRQATGPPGTAIWSKPGQFPADRFKGYTQVYNFPSMSWGSNSSSLNWTHRFELKDDFTHSQGAHSMKFGFDYARYISDEDAVANLGTWTFSKDQFFDGSAAAIAALTTPTTFTASFPSTTRRLQNYWVNGYAQDEWKPKANLTLNFGIRYDLQPKSFNQQLDLTGRESLKQFVNPTTRHDHNNFGPRLGLSWDMRNDGKTLVRLAYGRFYQYLPQGSLRAELNTLQQNSISITNPSYPDPYNGLSPQAFVTANARPNVSIVDDRIRMGSGDTITGGVSQQLRANLAVHVDGVYTKLRDLSRTQNINQPVPAYDFFSLDAASAAKLGTLSNAQLNAARPLANWGNVTQLTSSGWEKYPALYVRLDKRYSNHYQALMSYTREWTTLSAANITDYYHPQINEGPSGRKNQFVGSGYVRLPLDLTLGAVWTWRSALPWTASSGVAYTGNGTADLVPGTTTNEAGRDSASTAKVLGLVNAWRGARGLAAIPANQLQTSNYNSVDMRISRTFRLPRRESVELLMQVLNVFGRDNLIGGTGGTFVNNALSNQFGTYLVAGPRQQAEVGIDFKF